MNSFRKQFLLLFILALVLCDMVYYRHSYMHLYQGVFQQNKNPYYIHIDLDDYKMYVFKDDEIIKIYPVSGGKQDSPSPLGTWTIISKADWEKALEEPGWASMFPGNVRYPRNR